MSGLRFFNLIFICGLMMIPASADDKAVLTEFEMAAPPGRHCPLSADGLNDVKSYGKNQPVIGTYFFYWYDIESRAHFLNHDGSDALVDHPVDSNGFSYKSTDWWKRELLDVSAAGIDFILPVFWGCPGYPDSWSFIGLPPLVQAWEALTSEGKHPPRVGLFYDTTTLRHNPAGRQVDLSKVAGKKWFYATIRDYYSFIPPKMWAAIDGRPITALYSSHFAAKQDAALFPFVRKRFEEDFKTDLFLVKSPGWEGESDTVCAWGGALGLQLHGVASLGPGYDHHAVPNRKPLVVDREKGAFYSRLWETFLARKSARRPRIVMIETWNELHEGTDICATKEYGREYIELTARYALLFKAGAVLPRKGPFSSTKNVEWDAGRPKANLGMAVLNGGDGLVKSMDRAGRKCLQTVPNPFKGKYVYFELDDSFLFDEEGASITVEVKYLDVDFSCFILHYDSNDPAASLREGAFKSATSEVRCAGTGTWKQASIRIPDGRFANRCNGADFRFEVRGGDLAVSHVKVGDLFQEQIPQER